MCATTTPLVVPVAAELELTVASMWSALQDAAEATCRRQSDASKASAPRVDVLARGQRISTTERRWALRGHHRGPALAHASSSSSLPLHISAIIHQDLTRSTMLSTITDVVHDSHVFAGTEPRAHDRTPQGHGAATGAATLRPGTANGGGEASIWDRLHKQSDDTEKFLNQAGRRRPPNVNSKSTPAIAAPSSTAAVPAFSATTSANAHTAARAAAMAQNVERRRAATAMAVSS